MALLVVWPHALQYIYSFRGLLFKKKKEKGEFLIYHFFPNLCKQDNMYQQLSPKKSGIKKCAQCHFFPSNTVSPSHQPHQLQLC